ncbi:MAG: magnesium/cobalt transporter CorA [Anaerolineae bacterium]|nr:magnesium/cobalt transporter CorA [Anaerolineae bacterium]
MRTIIHKRVTWTNITHPTPDDVELLRQQYPQFHPLDLEDLLSHIERPKLDEYDEYLFTVMQFPLWDPVARISRPSEVYLFLGSHYLVTVHDNTLKPLTKLYERCQEDEDARDLYLGGGASRLFYTVIDQLVDYIFPILYKVDANIHAIEEEIFNSDARNMIRSIAWLRRDNIALRRIVRPQVEVIELLERVDRPMVREELDVYFGDIRDHLQKAVDIILDHGEVLVSLSDTLNTLANYRTNEVINILTIISVVLMPLTLISGVYGMNVDLPLGSYAHSFWFIVMLMILTATSMLAFFRWRGWI